MTSRISRRRLARRLFRRIESTIDETMNRGEAEPRAIAHILRAFRSIERRPPRSRASRRA